MRINITSKLTNRPHPTTDSASTTRFAGVLAMLYSVFLVYGSLVPLQFVPRPFDEAITTFLSLPFLSIGMDSRADWVANILLFIPLSLLYNQLATSRTTGKKKLLISLAVLAATAGLSCGIEFAQLFFPARTTSQNDIWANCLGSAIGIASQNLWGTRLQTWLDALWHHESSKNRLMRALNVYLAILLAFSVLPLELTISPVELYHKWSEGGIVLVPFASLKGNLAEKIYETLTDLLIWVPVGLLWSLNTKHRIARITAMSLLAATFIETAQLFVYSRVTDVTDILLAGVGATAGALGARYLRTSVVKLVKPNTALWYSFWIVWAISILAIFWFPYNFDVSSVTLGRAKAIFFRPLLESYYFGSEFHATNELLRKLGFFLPGGILWGAALHQGAKLTKSISIKGISSLFTVALLVEIGQLYLPQKYADLTDVFIQTAGGLVGLVIARWVLSGHSSLSEQLPENTSYLGHTPATDQNTKSLASNPKWTISCSRNDSLMPERSPAPEPCQRNKAYPNRSPNLLDQFFLTAKQSLRRTNLVPFAVGIFGLFVLMHSNSFAQLPYMWKLISGFGLFLSTCSLYSPFAPLLAYIAVAYGLPRYTDDYLLLMTSNVLTWIAITGATGSLILFLRRRQLHDRIVDLIFVTMLVFFAWLCASWLHASFSNSLYIADLRHHPVLFLHGLLLLAVTALTTTLNHRNIRLILIVLPLVPLVRWAIQGNEAIYLDGDISAMAAIVLPFAIVGGRLSSYSLFSTIHILTSLMLVGLIGYAQNRAAGVAMVLGSIFLFRHTNHKLAAVTVCGCVIAIATLILPLDRYLARYSVIWNSAATHATASLDRSTIQERVSLWESSIEMANDHPVIGVGLGNYANEIRYYQIGKDKLVAHNSLLNLAAEAGYFSIVIYFFALLLAFIRTEKLAKIAAKEISVGAIAIQAALIAQFVAGIFVSRQDQVLQFILIGAVISLSRMQTKAATGHRNTENK